VREHRTHFCKIPENFFAHGRRSRQQRRGRREHLNDDLHVVTLSKKLLAAPPVDLWPNVIRRLMVPADVEALLLTELERVQ
jgi:hypothetical protein